MTFHSHCCMPLHDGGSVLAGDEPPRLLSAPEQLLEIRRMLKGEAQDDPGKWPEQLRAASGTRFPPALRDPTPARRNGGPGWRRPRRLGKQKGRTHRRGPAGPE